MISYDKQVQGEEIRAEGRGRKDLFLLNDKSRVKQVEEGRYGRWGCNSGGSEGHEVFLEEMTIQISAGDREWFSWGKKLGKLFCHWGKTLEKT